MYKRYEKQIIMRDCFLLFCRKYQRKFYFHQCLILSLFIISYSSAGIYQVITSFKGIQFMLMCFIKSQSQRIYAAIPEQQKMYAVIKM